MTECGGNTGENMILCLTLVMTKQGQEKEFPDFREGQKEEEAESEYLSSKWEAQGVYSTIDACDGKVCRNLGSYSVDKNCM